MFREQIGRMWTGHRFLWWLMHTSNIPLVVNHSLFSARTTTRQHVCRHQSGNGAAAPQLRRAVLRLEMRCKIQHGRIMNRRNRATGSMGPNGSLMRCEVCLQHSPTTPEFAAQPFRWRKPGIFELLGDRFLWYSRLREPWIYEKLLQIFKQSWSTATTKSSINHTMSGNSRRSSINHTMGGDSHRMVTIHLTR